MSRHVPAVNAGAIMPLPAAPAPIETKAVRRRHRHTRRAARLAPSAPAMASLPTPSVANFPTPAASPTPAVRLAGVSDGPSTDNLIEDAAKRLAHIDRSKLAAADAAAYDQARSMLASAQAARRQGDDLAATGFASKASALAKSLPGAP